MYCMQLYGDSTINIKWGYRESGLDRRPAAYQSAGVLNIDVGDVHPYIDSLQ